MDVLGIYGSPRKGGNTDTMLDAFLEGAEAAGARPIRVYVRRLRMQGCIGCGGCDATGECVVEDAMTDVYPLLEATPRIVVASPIYFYGVTGQLKLLIDRSQACYMRRELEKREERPSRRSARKGFLLSAGATRGNRLFHCAALTLQYFFDALDMDYTGELCFRQIEHKGDIQNHPAALDECRQAGRNFVETG